MKLLGRRTSVNVQKVLWTLAEQGLEVEQVDLGGPFGGLDDPEYRRLNPLGKVPTLIDGDLAVWESNAIVRHLARTQADGRLAGATDADRARADIWMEWFQNNVYPHYMTVFVQAFRLPRLQRDAATLAAALERLTESLALIDRHLSDHAFVAGDQLSMGDIPVGASLYRYFTMEIDRPDLPHLTAYYDRLCARPAYADHVMVSYESLRLPGD